MDKVFVITVCRNADKMLESTILSVLNQTYEHLHYVIVDGASTDGSVDVIRKYEHQLAAWVSEPDNGIYDAMNKGLSIVRQLLGKEDTAWINFMNAGDRFSDNNVVSDVFNIIIPKTVIVVLGNINLCFADKKTLKEAGSIDMLPSWMPFCHQATFVRKDYCVFDTRYQIAADYDLFYKLYDKYGSDAFLAANRIVADFQMEGSTTYSNLMLTAKEGLQIRSKHKNVFWWKLWMKYQLCRLGIRNSM